MAEIQPIARRGDKPASSTLKKPPPKGTDQRHPAGIFADQATDGPIIGTLVCVIDKAKNLPNLKSIGKQDPYCVVRLGKHARKTEPDKRGGQTPKWDAELRFPVHDSADYRNLKINIFTDDKKTELIGETLVNLDNILDTSGGGQCDGWQRCEVKGRYAGDIRVELTFWDERPRETAPLPVNTRQITGFEKEDFKRPDKLLAGPRRPGVPPKRRELPEQPRPTKELPPADSTEEEEEEEPEPSHRRDRERHRDKETRERHREDRRHHRDHRREKSRHRREPERHAPEEYGQYDGYQHQNQYHGQHEQALEPYGHYQNQAATLQDFQSDHIGRLQAQYSEQTQLVSHQQRHSPNPAGYSGYQQDYYDQNQQWQHQQEQNMSSMVLASQNAPPPLPQHRHVEFTDNRRSMALPPPQPQPSLQHRKSRSEFYGSNSQDLYQQGNPYDNQLVSTKHAPPPPPPSHGYNQSYSDQLSFNNQAYDQLNQTLSNTPVHQQQQQQQLQQPLQYQNNGMYQSSYHDQYPEQTYQSQLAGASDFAPPPPPQHHQAASFGATPTPRDDYNAGALALSRNVAPPPPPPTHRNTQARMSMPPLSSAASTATVQTQQIQSIPLQQSITPQPFDTYDQNPNSQLQLLRGFAPPPPVPSHGGAQYQAPRYQPVPSPQPTQLQPPVPEQTAQTRPRGGSEPPPYADVDHNTPSEPQNFNSYAQQEQNGYIPRQSLPSGYGSVQSVYSTPTPVPSDFPAELSKRHSGLFQPQNPEHAFDPTTALILGGGAGGPPPLPSHGGARGRSPNPQAARATPAVPPISTNVSARKPLSRSPSPHPLSLTPGYGPDSPGDEMLENQNSATFAQYQQPPAVEPVVTSNYHAPYVKDVTGRRSMDSRVSLDSARPSVSPLIQPASQPLDTNRRRSVSPMPPLNNYSQELVSSRGAPPPLPPPSHRMSHQLVYKLDPTEPLSASSNRNSAAYDYPAQSQSHNKINHGIIGAQLSEEKSSPTAPIPVARDLKRQPYIEDELDETDRPYADSTYQSASTSWATSQQSVIDDYPPSSRDVYDASNQTPPSNYGTRTGQHQQQQRYGGNYDPHMSSTSPAPFGKPRAISPLPGRRNSDLPPLGRTPEPPEPKPVERRMTLGSAPFSPDDYDIINPVSNYASGSRSPGGNISASPLARSPGAVSPGMGAMMTTKEEKKARKEEEKAAKKNRKKFYTPNSANRDLADDDILAPDTFAPEPARRNSFNAAAGNGMREDDDEVQPLSFRPRRQSASPQPPGADIYGTSPGGRGGSSGMYKNGPKSIASNSSSNPSTGYGYGAPPPHQGAGGGGSRPLPGAPVMRNAIMGPGDDYYYQQQQQQQQQMQSRPMQVPQPRLANMSQEQWSLSQELGSISIGGSNRRRTGTWT